MSGPPNWWAGLPAAESWVPCGSGTHPVRWEDGVLSLPAHPDAEGELVLAALGGAKAGCVELAEAWARHAGDLEVLAIGPRSAADTIGVTWDDVEEFRAASHSGGPHRVHHVPRRPGRGGPRGPGGPGGWSPGFAPGHHPMQEEIERLRARQLDLLSLLALGPVFQMCLSGTVAAAWSDGGPRSVQRSANRPALEAALTGRLAPAAADWIGIDPDRVDVRLHDGPGWGSLEATGSDGRPGLCATLPAGWLASVWACGLALTGGHLVVAVREVAWPDAVVLAIPEPGRSPVALNVRAGAAGPAHWEVGPGAVPADAPGAEEAYDT
jgi:hypothetical protein